MLTDYFLTSHALQRFRSGSAGLYLDNFTEWLKIKKYKKCTVKLYIRLAARFIVWADLKRVPVNSLSTNDLDTFMQHLESTGVWNRKYGKNHIYYSASMRFLAFLQDTGVVTSKSKDRYDSIDLYPLMDFREWMRRHRGIAEVTLKNYSRVIAKLIQALGNQPDKYTAKSIRDFVLDRSIQHGHGYAEQVVTSVRNFIRFLIAVNACPQTFEYLIPSVAGWRLSRLPRYMDPADLEKVIESCDPSTQLGSRDHAIILLLARLGLRAGDAAGLRFRDIDWIEGTILIMGKSRRESRLPLSQDVGNAIIHYIANWRPRSSSDNVFLTTRAPYEPIASHVVSVIGRRAILRAGIDSPSHGAHVFRHSAATALLRKGVPLQAIGSVLRHDSIESTAHYAKIDVGMLKQLTVPWPEVKSC